MTAEHNHGVTCRACNGKGRCKRCSGTGHDPVFGYNKKCIKCGGSGHCPACNGTGKVSAR